MSFHCLLIKLMLLLREDTCQSCPFWQPCCSPLSFEVVQSAALMQIVYWVTP